MCQLDLLEAPNLLRSVPRSNQYNTDSHGLLAKFVEDPHPISSHKAKCQDPMCFPHMLYLKLDLRWAKVSVRINIYIGVIV